MRSLTWAQVWGRRLARHALLTPRPKSSPRRGCPRGGWYPCADDVRRRTLHRRPLSWRDPRGRARRTLAASQTGEDLRPARDGPSLSRRRGSVVGGGAPRASWTGEARRLAQRGLDPARLAAIVAAIGAALDGRRLTREELGEEVTRRTGAWAMDPVSPSFGGRRHAGRTLSAQRPTRGCSALARIRAIR